MAKAKAIEKKVEEKIEPIERKFEEKIKPIKKRIAFRIGDIGKDIKALQKKLGLPETGIYDRATDRAANK